MAAVPGCILCGSQLYDLCAVLGAAGPALAEGIRNPVTNTDSSHLDIPNAVVSGPAIQVLPMAIFL